MTVDRLIAIAAGVVGLGEADAAFRALCGPGETEQRQRELAGLSTCALFLRGCLAHAFLDGHMGALGKAVPPHLWAPYVIGRAMADIVEALPPERDRAGTRVWSFKDIRPGAIVIVGVDPSLHVYLVESVERDGWPDGSIEVTTIEAGQVDGEGRQYVARRRHEIDSTGIDRRIGEDGDGEPLAPLPRPVAYCLDPTKLLEVA